MKEITVKEAANPDIWVSLVMATIPWVQPFDKDLIEKLKEDIKKDGV